MTEKKYSKKIILTILFSLLCLLTVSCGIPENGNASLGGIDNNAAAGSRTPAAGSGQKPVYIPSFQTLSGSENGLCLHLEYNGGSLYYSLMEPDTEGQNRLSFYRQDLAQDGDSPQAEKLYEDCKAWEELETDTLAFFTDALGNSFFILEKESSDSNRKQYFLYKYNDSGNELFRRDITAQTAMPPESGSLKPFLLAVTDSENRIYIGQNHSISLYDKEGYLQAKTVLPGELAGMDRGRDGEVYVTYHTNGDLVLGKVDSQTGIVTKLLSDFPGNGTLSGGTEYDILTMDLEKVYGFSIGMEAPEIMLTWADCGIYGAEIAYLLGMDEERLLAASKTMGTGKVNRILFLSSAGTGEIPGKEVITIGVMDNTSNQLLDTLVAGFNRNSGHYRAELIIYGEGCEDLSEELNTALDRANMAIVNGESPDLVYLNHDRTAMTALTDIYVKKGLLEDLTDYLDNSAALHRDDLLPPALEQFTYGDGLYGLPYSISLNTVMGRADLVGQESGWTIQDMEQFLHAHPDAELFRFASKDIMLDKLLRYNMINYVDWVEGTCDFDSEDFRELLEFSNRFPSNQTLDEELTPANGGVLLEDCSIQGLGSYTYYRQEVFGNNEITCIGFPGPHGSGTMLDFSCALGISSLSEHKEGAWEFLEFMMTDEELLAWNFPVNKTLLEKNFLSQMGMEYLYDDDGNILLDGNGDPLTRDIDGKIPGDLWPTGEDADAVMALLENAEPSSFSWQKLYNIVREEAAPYFHGQKTLDAVVDIIQRRAQLYVGESL